MGEDFDGLGEDRAIGDVDRGEGGPGVLLERELESQQRTLGSHKEKRKGQVAGPDGITFITETGPHTSGKSL